MNKEEIYDEQIAPLMTQIINICKTNKIAMVMQFAIPSPDNDDLLCTTALAAKEYNPPDHMVEATIFLRNAGQSAPFAITTKNGEGQVISQTIII